jgi:hypothetical protein
MARFHWLAAILALGLSSVAQAGPPVRIGIGIGLGVPYYRPYYPYPYYYGYPYAYPYVVPAPVVYSPSPVVVQPSTVVGTTPTPSYLSPPPADPNFVNVGNQNAQGAVDFHLGRLSSPDENLRRESVMELGRSKSERAIDPLAATLAGDRSASVRDAAARALGLIGSQRALTALIQAAQADPDRDVRHSAQFAIEIIRGNLQRN